MLFLKSSVYFELLCRFQRLSVAALGGLLAALSAAAALVTVAGEHRHTEEAAAKQVSSTSLH